ncbi:hypothetical protein ABPG74_006619 [Tetrahymena malaccensis]
MISAVAIRIQIIFLIIYIHVKGQYQCVEGCKSCVDINSNKKQNQCTQCFEDYELNSNNNLCIYTKCESGLFYDKDYHSDAVQDNNCVAICGPLSWRNQQASLCQSQLKCSTQFSSKQSMFQGEKIQDFFVYRNDYYVAQSNYLSIYDKNDLYFIKALQLLENDLNVFHVNGVIFVTSSDNVISIWDLKRESRISKKIDSQLMTEPFSKQTKINYMQNEYVFVYDIKSESITFLIFYDQLNQNFTLSNSFTINIKAQSIVIANQSIFISNSTNISVYKMIVSNLNSNLDLIIENHFLFQSEQNSVSFNILSTSQLGLYLLVQDQSIQMVNTNNNLIQSIQIGFLNSSKIIKAKTFQVSDINSDQYIIIQTLDKFIFYNLLTNSSHQILTDSSQIKNFEICHFWGNANQLIVLFENLNLQVFYLDQNLQEFIKSNSSFQLNYNSANFFQIKYQNLNSNNKEFVYEIISTNTASIQIIKKGNLQQQENQLIQIQSITNFNLGFPDLSHNNSITKFNALQLMVLSYYPSLIVSVNRNGQINFFDTADLSNCKLKKQIWPNQNINFITKFYNNKLIASSQNLVWIIDIFTQNVIKFFGSEYLLYATNSDQLVLVANECLRVYSSELLMKYENCQVLKNLTSNQSINLNNDLRVLLTDRGSDQQHLSFFTYQIDLIQQTFILTNTLKALDCYSFQIIKKFSSLQDEVNNNFSIQQIVIFDQNGNLKIYDMTLSLIYKKDSIKISNVNLINRVFNDDNAYILIGDVQLLLINTSTSNYNLIQLDFNATNQISIFETEKRINLYGKSYYYVKLFINNQIYEYQIDNQKNITYVSSLIQFKDSTINSYQLQNIKNSINAAVNYFEGGTTGLLYTSLTLKQRYSQIQATPLQSGVYNLFQNYRLGILYILHDYCYASIFDMFTSKQQQTIYNCLNINSRYLIIKDAAVIVNFTNKSKKLQINLIDFSQKITTVSYENTSDLINGFNYDENENLIYSYGKSLQLFNYQLQLVNVIDSGYFKQCYSAKQKLICLEKVTIPQQQPLFRILMYDKNSKNIQKFDLVQQKDQSQNIMIDEQQENIYFLGSNICKINSFNGSLKQQFDKNFNSCQIYSNIVVCDSSNYLIIIDRFSLTLTELGFPLENSTIQRYTYIDFLNYILFQISASPYQVSVLDVAAKKIINSFSSVLSQNQSVKPNIVNFQLDYTSNSTTVCNLLVSNQELEFTKQQMIQILPKQTQIQTINGISIVDQQNLQNNIYLQIPGENLQNIIQYTSQLTNKHFVISSNSIQNSIIPLEQNTFSNLTFSIFQLSNFTLDFQNNSNLIINLTENPNTKQIIFQNITIHFQCFGNNKIIIQNIEKVVFQNIKISQLQLNSCSDKNQQNPLLYFYNISKIPIFQFEKVNTIQINYITVNKNTNLNSMMSFLDIQNPRIIPVKLNFLNDIIGSGSRQLQLGVDCLVKEPIIRDLTKTVFYTQVQFLIPVAAFIFIPLTLTKYIYQALIFKLKCDQIYHSNYAFKETVEIQEPSSIEGDIFMIGLLLVETFLKRPLTPQEKIDINRQNIFSVFPDLKSSKHIQFIKKIISPMIDPSKQVRIEPAELIQNLKEFHINEEQLKQLKLQQRHRKFQTSHIEDILKGIHYDILIINLVWNDFIADGPKQIGLSLEKCHNISQLSLNLAQYLLNQYFYLMQLLIRLKQIK